MARTPQTQTVSVRSATSPADPTRPAAACGPVENPDNPLGHCERRGFHGDTNRFSLSRRRAPFRVWSPTSFCETPQLPQSRADPDSCVRRIWDSVNPGLTQMSQRETILDSFNTKLRVPPRCCGFDSPFSQEPTKCQLPAESAAGAAGCWEAEPRTTNEHSRLSRYFRFKQAHRITVSPLAGLRARAKGPPSVRGWSSECEAPSPAST